MSTTTGERFTIGEIQVGFLLEGEASGGSVAVFEFTVPAGARVPISHSHDAYEETVYGLEGTLTWTVDAGWSTSVRAMCCAFLAEPSTASTTSTQPTRGCWPS